MTTVMARINSACAEVERNRRYEYALLAAVTLLAAVLRLYKLGEWNFWIDEIFTIGHVQAHYGDLAAIIRNTPPARNWVPVSLILTGRVLNTLGVGEWSARLVAASVGIVSVPALYFPIKRLFNPGVGLATTLLLAVSPWHLYWSQNARFYTSLMLFYSLAAFAFFWGLERDRPGYLVLFIALLYLATSERLMGLFLLPVVACYIVALWLFRFERPPGLRARNLLLLALPAIAFVGFEIFTHARGGYPMTTFTLDIFGGEVNHSPARLLASMVYRISVPLVCLGTCGGIYLLSQKDRAGAFLCAAAWVPPLLLLLMAPFAFTVDRYVFVALPFWMMLGAVAVKELLSRVDQVGKILAVGVLLLLVADSLGQTVLYYQYQNGNRPRWREAFALVGEDMTEDDLVLATRPELGHYYLTDDVACINSADPATMESTGGRAWFVIDEATGWVAPEIGHWIRENAGMVDVLQVRMPGKSLSIYVYLYNPGGRGEGS